MEAFLCLVPIYIYMYNTYIYNYVPYTYGTVVPAPSHRCAAARHETHHGHVLRHAMEHVHHGCPLGTIHPHSRTAPLSFTGSRSCFFSPTHYFFHFSSIPSLSSRYLLFPHPPCYRVQGQLIEGNFLVPIASACPLRTILFMLLFLF